MRKTLLSLAALALLGAATAAMTLYLGVISVAADEPHHPLLYRLLELGRERSIAARARGIAPPIDLASPERVRRGAGNYDAMCAGCHLSPGAADSEIRKGLYPSPPRLADKPAAAIPFAEARRFWIIKHGIKASAMPAWSKGGMEDDAIWDLVAFLQRLPGFSAADYAALVASSEGHSHGGLAAHEDHGAHRHDGPAAAVRKGAHIHPPGFRHTH